VINIANEQIKLSDLNIFSADQLKKLQDYSISSAEQFVGICATPEGFSGLRQALGVSQNQLNQMLYEVRTHLPPELAELLSKPTMFSPALGARKPKKKYKSRKKREV
jgi:hypothetical protein